MTDSKLNELCQQIIAKHRNALEILIEHMDSPKSVAKSIVDGLLEDSGWKKVSFYRFPSNWLEIVPKGYDGNPIVLFWVDYAAKSLSILMEIQPGELDIRQRLLDAAIESPIFNPARKTLGSKFKRILRFDLASSSQQVNQDPEEWEEQVREGFTRFCTDVPPVASDVLLEASKKMTGSEPIKPALVAFAIHEAGHLVIGGLMGGQISKFVCESRQYQGSPDFSGGPLWTGQWSSEDYLYELFAAGRTASILRKQQLSFPFCTADYLHNQSVQDVKMHKTFGGTEEDFYTSVTHSCNQILSSNGDYFDRFVAAIITDKGNPRIK